MGKLKAKILAWLADDDAPDNKSTSTAPSDSVSSNTATVVPARGTLAANAPDDDVDDLPIHTAPAAQIDYWHASGCNGFLQAMLRPYALDYTSPNVHAYDRFKIGLNEARHEATFAIDYLPGSDVRYYVIAFNEKNSAPIDREQARRVLERVSRLTGKPENLRGLI